MRNTLVSFSAFLCTLLALTAPRATAQLQVYELDSGRVALHFESSVLEGCGLTVTDLAETESVAPAATEGTELPLVAFALDSASDLLLMVENDGFVPYGVLGGSLRALGGFTLGSPSTGQSVDLHDFVIHVSEVRNDGPAGQPDPDYFHLSRADVAAQGEADFLLCYVKVSYDPEGLPYGNGPGDHVKPVVRIKAWDLIISAKLARDLGRPDLEGRLIGSGKIDGFPVAWNGPWTYPPGQNPSTPYGGGAGGAGPGDGGVTDVRLGILSGITVQGHVGTFPDGRVGLASSTTSCNVGDVNVDWLAPMNEGHPGITQSLYRQLGNRFEQVGAAWVKHGFFALSNSQCTPCQGGSPNGKFLGVGCSDTYGASNNGDRMYLGPRDEWNPHTAEWEACGSFFDDVPVDCIRDEFGSGWGAVDHRLEAFDADLDLDGATYFYEANYLVKNDADKLNNIGSRRCEMSWNGSVWTFTTPSAGSGNPLVAGAAINRYGELRTEAGLGSADGRVILAVQTEDLGGGLWRYEYALYNWDLDRRVRAFSVPSCGNASDFYFHDIDDQAGNDWVPVTAGGNVTWTFPDVSLPGHKVGGPLGFATLYNFGFTSDVAPGPRDAALAIHDAGAGGDLLGVSTLAPACLDLSATNLAPPVSTPFAFTLTGGTTDAMLVLLEVNGIPIPGGLLLGPLPFVGGVATLNASVPPAGAGLSLLLLGAEVTLNPLQVVELSDLLRVEVQ